MKLFVSRSTIKKSVCAPVSKSDAHRFLIARALSEGEMCKWSDLENEANSNDDTRATFFGLKSIMRECENRIINVGESATTLRMLLPIVCALNRKATFVGEGRISQRPLKELVGALNAHGAKICGDSVPLSVEGALRSGLYEIAGDISSQYISGLLFALPLVNGDSEIAVKGARVSQNYTEMSVDMLKRAGIEIVRTQNGFFIKGNQRYALNSDVKPEKDWSSAAVLLGMGALCGEVQVRGLDLDSKQPDIAIIDMLGKMGGRVDADGDSITAYKSKLRAIEADVSQCIDIAPVLSVLCANAEGTSRIFGVLRLKHKESDRLQGIVQMLSSFGIDCATEGDCLRIRGGKMKACKWQTRDHRMAMSGILSAMCADGESEIDGAECISKSYPMFLRDIGMVN